MASLDIDHLRTFRAVLETGSFGRAAKVLHLSQPAVSSHIQQLEARLGVELFNRQRRGRISQLTPQGAEFVTDAAKLLDIHDGILSEYGRDARRTITVGFSPTTIDQSAVELLDVLRERQPEWDVHPRIGPSATLRRMVNDAEIDIALVADFGDINSAEPKIGDIPLRWFASPEFTLPEVGEELPVITYASEGDLSERGLHALESDGWSVGLSCQTVDSGSAAAAGRAGLGVVLLAGDAPCVIMQPVTSLPLVTGLGTHLVARRGLPRSVVDDFLTVFGNTDLKSS